MTYDLMRVSLASPIVVNLDLWCYEADFGFEIHVTFCKHSDAKKFIEYCNQLNSKNHSLAAWEDFIFSFKRSRRIANNGI